MKAKTASPAIQTEPEAAMWQASVLTRPTFTPRERLHQNILRLQTLDQQLLSDATQLSELLTSIELAGFKIRHLARQILDAERMSAAASLS